MACIYWSITIKISLKAKQECPTANDEIKRNRKRRWHSAMLEMKKQGNIFLLDDVHWLSKSLWKLLDCEAVELAMIYHKNGRLAQTLFRAHLQSRTEHSISSRWNNSKVAGSTLLSIITFIYSYWRWCIMRLSKFKTSDVWMRLSKF